MIDWACSSEAAYRPIRSSNVPFVSSIKAHNSPGHGPSIRPGSLVNDSSPNASARRLAGSMVTTHDRRPARAPCSAMAAAAVVLPTPPEPQQMTI